MKNTILKTLIALMLAAVLLTGAAQGEARYPAQNGALTDDANALGQTMAKDIAAYAEKVESETNARLHVALVLFLDGEPAQTYADGLFIRWQLGENDLLLLGAAAEDSFAVTAGDKVPLSGASLKNLLYSSGFSTAFENQRYDEAFGKFFIAFNAQLAKQEDTQIKLGSLFEDYQAGATTQTVAEAAQTTVETTTQAAIDSASAIWTSTINSVADSVQNYRDYHSSRSDENGGLSTGGWIVLVIIALLIFGQRRGAKRGRGGCGCSPIGWIIGGLGLGALFDRHRDSESYRNRHGHGRR